MSDFEYVRAEDRAKYWSFCLDLIKRHSLARPDFPEELWHYTTADGLIGILAEGKIWSTQVACLNDSLEQRYFAGLVHEAVKSSREHNTDANLAVLLSLADKGLSEADFAAHGRFVTCFSENEDDLGQWRGYGGGECGFAIGLRTDSFFRVVSTRQWTLLVPLNYKIDVHRAVAEDVVRGASRLFLEGLQRHPPCIEQWATQFLRVFTDQVDFVGASIKHHAFRHEAEWRLVTSFLAEDVSSLIFRQKRTLLARHLPISFEDMGADGKFRLPITRIYVGPGPAQRVSQVGAGDLLKKHGYRDVTIKLSKVPYRLP